MYHPEGSLFILGLSFWHPEHASPGVVKITRFAALPIQPVLTLDFPKGITIPPNAMKYFKEELHSVVIRKGTRAVVENMD